MKVQGVIALGLHLVAGYFYVLSGLVAPPYAVVSLLAFWLLLLWCLIRMPQGHWKVLIVPAVARIVWFSVLMLGDVFLGWTV